MMPPDREKSFAVGEESVHQRLDVFVSRQGFGLSRSQIQRLIAEQNVSVNKKFLKPSHRLNFEDVVHICIPEEAQPGIAPEKIPLDILYEDEELLVVNKSAGIIVHPVKPSQRGTLVNALLAYTEKLSAINGPLRRGIVHRLDKDTSGALIVAKNDRSHLHISQQIKQRKVKRRYKALVQGRVEPDEGRIVAPVGRHVVSRQKMSVRYAGGREAITNYNVIERFGIGDIFFSLLDVSLETGRTHQIRVHLASIGYPVAADATYGKKCDAISMNRQALHAELIGFLHPSTEEYMEFIASLPEDMVRQIGELKKLNDRGPTSTSSKKGTM